MDYALVSIPPTGCLVALGQELSFPSRPFASGRALNIATKDRLKHALAHSRLSVITGLVNRRFFLSHASASFRRASLPWLSPPAFSFEPSSSLIQIFCVHRHTRMPCHAFRLFRALIDFAFDLASALLLAPQARKDNKRRVGSPFLRSGPLMFPMRARKDARRGLSPDLTGRFRFMPWARAERRPASFKPPLGFLPALRCQAGVLPTTHRSGLASSVRAFRPSDPRQGAIYILVTRPARQTLFSSASHQAFLQRFRHRSILSCIRSQCHR